MLEVLKTIPPEAYTAFVTALLTASVTLVAVHLTNRNNTTRLLRQLDHEKSLNRERIRRERGEELYVLSEKYFTWLVSDYLPYLRVMQNELTYNEALDLTLASDNSDRPDFQRLEMLVDLYFPDLTKPLQAVFSPRDQANKLLAIHKTAYKQGETDGRKYIRTMNDILAELQQATAEFREQAVRLVRAV